MLEFFVRVMNLISIYDIWGMLHIPQIFPEFFYDE